MYGNNARHFVVVYYITVLVSRINESIKLENCLIKY